MREARECHRHENPGAAPAAVISRSCPRADTVVCAANAIGLTPTECGQPWIYDEARTDDLFSDARNSCGHNPGRLTRCGFHDPQRHRGAWKTCTPCRDALAAENDVDLGPHQTHVERLENPPAVALTRCSVCHPCIRLDKDRDRRRASDDVGWSSGEAERPKG
jgi:hypothetical protein